MKDEYYQLRRWDVATGLQTRTQLEEVRLRTSLRHLEVRGCWLRHTGMSHKHRLSRLLSTP